MQPVEIPLKLKYRASGKAPNYGHNGDHQGNKKPRKIGYDKHVALYGVPPVRVLFVNTVGHGRMVTVVRLSDGPHPQWEF